MSKDRIKPIVLRAINSNTLGVNYIPINAVGLDAPCSILRIINASDKDVAISFDGIHDSDFIVARGTLQLPAQSNSQPNNYRAMFPKGLIIYAKGASGTGVICVTGYTQE